MRPAVFACPCLLIAFAMSFMPTVARSEEDSVRANPGAPEEIVVTAERREASSFDVPISVEPFSAENLQNSALVTTFDLQKRSPSLVISRNSILTQPYIRGVGSDLITAGADPSVLTLVDNVSRTRSLAAEVDFFDVERVEIVKGPQSTLFGRNATGGVIHVLTRRPQPEVEAYARLIVGSFEALRLEGALNTPILNEKLLLRVSGMRHQKNGEVSNRGPGG